MQSHESLRNTKVKTTVRDDLRPTGAPQREKGEITSIGKGVGKLEPSCTAGRNRKRCCNLESSQATPLKFRHRAHMTQTVHAMVHIAKRIGNRYPPKNYMHAFIYYYLIIDKM